MATVFKRKNAAGRKLPNYYIKYKDENGVWQTIVGNTNKADSLRIGQEKERRASLVRAGIAVPEASPVADDLASLVKSYARNLQFKGDTESHIDLTTQQLTSIFEGCKFAKLRDLQINTAAERVINYLLTKKRASKRRPLKAVRKRDRKPPERPPEELDVISPRTRKLYLASLKGFCRWCISNGKMTAPACPLLHIKVGTQKSEAKKSQPPERRAATDSEVKTLLTVARGGSEVEGLTGVERYHLYRTALGTGFRASELASRHAKHFLTKQTPPTLQLEWVDAKDGKDAGPKLHNQPLHPDLAKELAKWLKGRAADSPVWPGNWHKKAAEMLRADLKSGGIPYETAAGVLDFHALRVTFITSLARAGVHPKTAQILARHSDINLTMKVYTKLGIDDTASAVPPPVSV